MAEPMNLIKPEPKAVATPADAPTETTLPIPVGISSVPRPEEISNPRGPLLVGLALILLTFFGLGIWAAVSPISSAVVASGWVAVETNRRTIQHLEGGVVGEILVREGSAVKAGDTLVRLDPIRPRAQLEIFRADLDSSLATEARLLAERDGLMAPVFPKELLDRKSIPSVKDIVDGQIHVFKTRREALNGQKSILEQRVAEYRQQIVGLKALDDSKRDQLKYIKDELNSLIGLLDQGIVPRSRVLALQREAARLEGERGDHIASIARSEQGIGETKLQIIQIEKGRQEDVAKDLKDVQSKLTELKQKIVAANDVMRRIDITSPIDGTVMNLAIHTIGGVISPGNPIMEVVPENDRLVIECQINPSDIDTIRVNGEVAIHISAADSRLTPVIYGVLETISPDRIVDSKAGIAYYKGVISIPPDQIERLGSLTLHAGMPVEAFISRGERTVLNYIMKPLFDALSRSLREK